MEAWVAVVVVLAVVIALGGYVTIVQIRREERRGREGGPEPPTAA